MGRGPQRTRSFGCWHYASSCWATSAAPVNGSSRTPGTLSPCSCRRLENTWLPLEERTPRTATKVLSVPAGMIRGADYTQAIVRLAVGDVLVLYTGGLTEAVNGLGEDLGLPALFEAACRAPSTRRSPWARPYYNRRRGQFSHGRRADRRSDPGGPAALRVWTAVGDTSGGIVTVPVKVGGFRRGIDGTSKQDREESSTPPLLIGKTGVGMGYQGRHIRPEHGNP